MSKNDEVIAKLDERVKVLLKKWAGLSGFHKYKDMDLDEIFQLVNTEGWQTEIDKSDPLIRAVQMSKETTHRRAKFVVDEQGRVIKEY
ncbi:hypothetical protein [Paenibacillus agricola]|uniref:Uncharacterized protein n=1 Tax=Paenibacillus agricola TaxID=2716264 RepID=A0ABX0J1K8_9BACL|nr:hypothetical protein [Paenibacillus agricola]NHN29568.1 hypothetical protein [Paenibacillus agricola]